MEAALERDVLPALASIVDRRAPSSITLRVFPRTAAEVSALVADVEDRAGGVTLEVSQEGPEVLVAIHAVAASASEARRRARRAGAEVCTRLGHDVHGPLGQDLAAAAVEALTARGWTLAAIEIGAGGAVTSQLSDVPGGDRVLRLGLALGDEPALLSRLLGVPPERLSDGVVSAPAAAALADGARRLAGAGLGLAVAALAGPSGGAPETPVGLVHFAITDRGGERLTSRRFRSLSRPVLRQWCAATALRLVLDRCREKGG
jgi:nicotinamide-nucleotide amidase